MYYQSQDIRGSTLAISESLKYRKSCLNEHSSSKKPNSTIANNQNYSPLFQTETKTRNNSIQLKKQSRRKTGSIGKIVRNNHSNEKNYGLQERTPLTEANNFLNQKLQYEKDNQNVGNYKKLYEQNKVLNQALKSRIYQTPHSSSYKTSIMEMNNYKPESKTMTKVWNYRTTKDQQVFNTNLGHENSRSKQLDMKYQSMLAEYDKKKNLIKQELLALKQKTSIQNFSSTKNPVQQNPNKLNYQYNSRGNDILTNSNVDEQKFNVKTRSISRGFTSNQKESHTVTNPNHHNETESQIDSKFKAYQQKVQKHKEFQKRNSSANKYSQLLSNQKQNIFMQPIQLKNSTIFQQIKIVEKCNPKSSQIDTIKIFADLLMKQIEKDEEVRIIKNNLKNFSIQEIQKILKERYSFDIDSQKLRLSTQEYDPFFQSKQSQKSIDKLAWQFMNAYEIAQNFWKNLIIGKFNSQELQKIYNTLNYSKKDKIELNEFARQISFHSNKTIRGRQIFQSYRRLTPLTKQNFLTKLLNKQ